MNKLLIIKISVIIAVSLILFFGFYISIQFYDKVKPLNILTTCENNNICNISTTYDFSKKKMLIIITEPSNILEYWQYEFIQKTKDLDIKLILPKTDYLEFQSYNWTTINTFTDQSLKIYFTIKNINLYEYEQLKKHIQENAINKKIKLILPDIISTDKKITEKLKNNYIKQLEAERIKTELKEYATKIAYRYVNGEASEFPSETDFRKCLFNIKGVCFGQPFFAKSMSYEDCKAEKNMLGIRYCGTSSDKWAATVKVCGGVQNLPTLNDLTLLADYMYGSRYYTIDGKEEGQRNNDLKIIEYFRDLWWNSYLFEAYYEEIDKAQMSFNVFSNDEIGETAIMIKEFANEFSRNVKLKNGKSLIFYSDSVKPAMLNYNEVPIISICVESRSNSISKPLAPKNYNSEVENDLF